METKEQSENSDIPIFSDVCDKWCGKEELWLLEAIEQNGYGNWKLIAEQLSQNSKQEFSSEEVQVHYERVYFSGKIGGCTWKHSCLNSEFPVTDHTTVEDVEELNLPDVKALTNFPEEFRSKLESLPLIDDSVKEYDMEAEDLIQDLEFNYYDDETDREMSFCLLEMYRRRVKARIHKQNARRCQKLVDMCTEFANEMLKSSVLENPENLEIREELNEYLEILPLAQILEPSEFQNYFENHIKEKRLKRKIEEFLAEEGKGPVEDNGNSFTCGNNNSLRGDGDRDADDIADGIAENNAASKTKIPKYDDSNPEAGCSQSDMSEDIDDMFSSAEISSVSSCEADGEESQSDEESKNGKNKLEGWSLLSKNERMLCEAFDLPPVCYIAYKVVLICADQDIEQGKSLESYNLCPPGLDKEQVLLIIDFMSENGWIKSENFKPFIP